MSVKSLEFTRIFYFVLTKLRKCRYLDETVWDCQGTDLSKNLFLTINTMKAILMVVVIAVLLGAVVPHTQSAFAQIMKFKQHPDVPPPPPTGSNPLGLIIPALGAH